MLNPYTEQSLWYSSKLSTHSKMTQMSATPRAPRISHKHTSFARELQICIAFYSIVAFKERNSIMVLGQGAFCVRIGFPLWHFRWFLSLSKMATETWIFCLVLSAKETPVSSVANCRLLHCARSSVKPHLLIIWSALLRYYQLRWWSSLPYHETSRSLRENSYVW